MRSVFASPKDAGRLEKMKNSGVALFGASWWAKAPLEALRIGTYLSIWVRMNTFILCVRIEFGVLWMEC